ncbi:MAG: hypothetical protein ACYST0_09005, partial [Planctomycetota bacterium]
MKYLFVSTLALALSAPLMAQTQMSSPDGNLTKEGSSFCRYFGPYAGGRQQFATGDLEGKSVMLTETAYRLDNRDHTLDTTMGRQWTNVRLMASECGIDAINVKLTSEWAKNSVTTPVEVFSGAVEWPTQVGYPSASSSVPAAWGGRKNRLRFPFKAPWSYTGKGGILLDYAFSGGELSDPNLPWGGASYKSYYLDSASVATSFSGALTYFGGTCMDSAQTRTAYTSVSVATYALNHPTATNRGKLSFSYFSGYTAPSAPVIGVLAAGGNTAGVDLGACNKLYLDLTKPSLYTVAKAGSGSAFYFGPTTLVAWKAGFAGKEIWGQTAWSDSKTAAFTLTRARRGIIPSGLPPTIKRGMVWHYDKSQVSGFDPTDATNF